MKLKEYGWNLAIALSQGFNALFGGSPDETMSSRIGRHKDKWYIRPLAILLNRLDPGHVEHAVEWERRHEHLPEELR